MTISFASASPPLIRILIVEDNPAQAYLQRKLLGVGARDGEPEMMISHVSTLGEASRILAKDAFELILLDLMLPDSGGLETLQAVRRLTRDAAIVVLSSLHDEEVALEALSHGAQDYLFKSELDAPRLRRSVRYALERRRWAAAQTELQRVQATLDSLATEVAALDQEGNIVLVNQAWRAFAAANEYPDPSAGVGVNYVSVSEGVVGDDAGMAHAVAAAIREVAAGRLSAWTGEYPCHGPEEERYFTVRVAPCQDAQLAVVVTHENVTSEKTNERAREEAVRQLRESVERFALVARATNDIIWDLDLRTGVVHWNEALTATLGYASADVGAALRWWEERIHPEDRKRVISRMQRAIRGSGSTWSAEYRLARADGTYLRVLDRAYLLRDSEGQAVRAIGSMLDLSYRERVEDAVRLQALLLDTVQQAVIATDVAGVITAWNPYAEQLYGWRAEEVIGKPRREVFGAALDGLDAEEAAALERGDSWSGELTITRRDGRRLTVFCTRSPVLDSTGRMIGVVGISTDLTEQRSLQEQLRQSQKMEAVGMLAGGVAHDFNNLLTVITGNISLLLLDKHPEDPEQEDLLEIRGAAERAAALTRQLLAFSRRQILRPQSLQVGALVTGLLPMLERLLGEDVELHFGAADKVGTVHADPGQLEQVIMNLVVNARDAMPAGGRIAIETAEVEFDGTQRAWDGSLIPAGRYCVLAISDTGIGIAPEAMSHIFEPFYTTKSVGRGTGLGLSTVYGIVRQSGGHIWAYSEPGVGSVFKIYLPVAAANEAATRPSEDPRPVGGTETILLVEDEDAVRMVARRALTRAGYTVLEGRDGLEAVEMATRHGERIDLVLMDVVMPNMGGPAAAQRLSEILDGVPVIFMSGYTDDEVLRRGVLPSETAFLQKPFAPVALMDVVRRTLDARVSVSRMPAEDTLGRSGR